MLPLQCYTSVHFQLSFLVQMLTYYRLFEDQNWHFWERFSHVLKHFDPVIFPFQNISL